jgi:hypothetical protein
VTKRTSANRRNSKNSTGPTDTTSTRFNATKHGLLSAGITELDNAEEYRTVLRDLTKEKDPQGPEETFHVESAALDMVRLRRARRLEAEYITEQLNPPIREAGVLANLDQLEEGALVDPGIPARMPYEGVQRLVNTFQRYETAIALRLSRTLHELERVQRMRKGDHVPAPAAVDVTITTHSGRADKQSKKNAVLEGSLSTHPHRQGDSSTGVAREEDEAAPPADPHE